MPKEAKDKTKDTKDKARNPMNKSKISKEKDKASAGKVRIFDFHPKPSNLMVQIWPLPAKPGMQAVSTSTGQTPVAVRKTSAADSKDESNKRNDRDKGTGKGESSKGKSSKGTTGEGEFSKTEASDSRKAQPSMGSTRRDEVEDRQPANFRTW